MSTREKRLGSTLLGIGMLLLGACDGPNEPRRTPEELFISTRFEDCGRGGNHSPNPISVDTSRLAALLHGTWVGTRAFPDGMQTHIHYVIIFDMESRMGLAYEEKSPTIRENAFARLLPRATPRAPEMVYLHCGVRLRDGFVKVSGNPKAGLAALEQVTATRLGGMSLADAYNTLRAAGVFTGDHGDTYKVGALFGLSMSTLPGQTSGIHEVQLEMAAQYSGSAAELSHDGAVSAVEGGVLQGVSTPSGDFLAGHDVNTTKAHCASEEVKLGCTHDQGGSASLSPVQRQEQTVLGTYRMVLGPIP